MSSRGAPTGKWETLPKHLAGGPTEADLRRAEAKLLVRRPGVPEVVVKVDKSEFVIGRKPNEVDLVLDDDQVSRKHARLSMDERGYFRLIDLGSRNGILFEGRPVRRLNLIDGDTFSIGEVELVFHAKMNRFGEDEASDGTAAPREESVLAEPPEPEKLLDPLGPPPKRE